MSETDNTARATISLEKQTMAEAKKRQKAMRYPKFSQYVAALIQQDLEKRGRHVIVREEPKK